MNGLTKEVRAVIVCEDYDEQGACTHLASQMMRFEPNGRWRALCARHASRNAALYNELGNSFVVVGLKADACGTLKFAVPTKADLEDAIHACREVHAPQQGYLCICAQHKPIKCFKCGTLAGERTTHTTETTFFVSDGATLCECCLEFEEEERDYG